MMIIEAHFHPALELFLCSEALVSNEAEPLLESQNLGFLIWILWHFLEADDLSLGFLFSLDLISSASTCTPFLFTFR